ncbi:hypothetical protein ACRRTK_017577 [Alexandromys fortis]
MTFVLVSNLEAETVGSPRVQGQFDPGQPRLNNETLSQQTKKVSLRGSAR